MYTVRNFTTAQAHELLSTTDRYSNQEPRTTDEMSPDLNQSTQAPELLSITDIQVKNQQLQMESLPILISLQFLPLADSQLLDSC